MSSLCLVAIFKNESHILKEFITHYIKQGVDHFFLIDNGSNDNYSDILTRLGYAPKIGSRFHTPFLNENWVIVERKLGEFKMYQATRLQCICSRFQESLTDGSNGTKQENVDFKIT